MSVLLNDLVPTTLVVTSIACLTGIKQCSQDQLLCRLFKMEDSPQSLPREAMRSSPQSEPLERRCPTAQLRGFSPQQVRSLT